MKHPMNRQILGPTNGIIRLPAKMINFVQKKYIKVLLYISYLLAALLASSSSVFEVEGWVKIA